MVIEMIARLTISIDSNWPGVRCGVSDVNWKDVKPFVLGMERKKQYDYRMPVWYTYGSREISYPIVAGQFESIWQSAATLFG